jgi:hypothetical protein
MKTYDDPSVTFVNGKPIGNFAWTDNPGELAFKTVCKNQGLLCLPSTEKENRYSHFDFRVTKGCKTNKIEVKYLPQGRDFIIQVKDYYGKPGAIYGQSDYLAYLLAGVFFIFKRSTLLAFALKYKEEYKVELMTQKGAKGVFFFIPRKVALDKVPYTFVCTHEDS